MPGSRCRCAVATAAKRAQIAGSGHEERFPAPRLSAGYAFRMETFTGMRHSAQDTPKAVAKKYRMGHTHNCLGIQSSPSCPITHCFPAEADLPREDENPALRQLGHQFGSSSRLGIRDIAQAKPVADRDLPAEAERLRGAQISCTLNNPISPGSCR